MYFSLFYLPGDLDQYKKKMDKINMLLQAKIKMMILTCDTPRGWFLRCAFLMHFLFTQRKLGGKLYDTGAHK